MELQQFLVSESHIDRERENKSDSTCGKSHSMRISIVEIWIVKIWKVYCLINSVSVYTIKSICYLRLDWNLRCLKHTFRKPSIWFFQLFFVVDQLQNFAIHIIICNVFNSMKLLLWNREIAFEINQMMCRFHFYYAKRIAAIIRLAATNCIGWTASCRTPLFFANSLWNNRL